MKTWIFGFVFGAVLFGVIPVGAEEVIRIEMGKRGSSNDRDTKRRMDRLEMAVEQLQRKVFALEMGNHPITAPISAPITPPASSMTTCYIKTTFDGTFSATEATETAARAAALERCNNKANGIYCQERDMKCGK